MWHYLTTHDAAMFMWNTSAAAEWDFYDFSEMVAAISKDTIYGYFDNDKLLAIVRFAWIMQPYSAYMWLWNDPSLRKKKSKILVNQQIFSLLYFHIKQTMKIRKLVALCVSKSVARLCQRYEGELKCELPDLYYKGKSAYIVFWDWS
jgi:hypothetical protein